MPALDQASSGPKKVAAGRKGKQAPLDMTAFNHILANERMDVDDLIKIEKLKESKQHEARQTDSSKRQAPSSHPKKSPKSLKAGPLALSLRVPPLVEKMNKKTP